MGKISKYSNLYDKNGEFLHGPGSYTIQECEELVDKLAEEVNSSQSSEDSNSKAYANAMATLMHMYEIKGNPHKDEILQKLAPTTQASPKISDYTSPKTTKAEVVNALNDLKNGETINTREEEKVSGTLDSSTEEPGGVQECNTDSEPSITA